MARWKARGRLPRGNNWTIFASYQSWGAMSRYWSKSLCSKGGWVTFSANLGGKGCPPRTIFGIRKLESLGYRMVKKIPKISTSWVGCTNVTDRQQTDRQTTDGRPIAYSERNVVRSLIIELFSLAITVEALTRNRCARKGGWSLSAQILGGKERPPRTIFGIRKLESLGMVKRNCRKFQPAE